MILGGGWSLEASPQPLAVIGVSGWEHTSERTTVYASRQPANHPQSVQTGQAPPVVLEGATAGPHLSPTCKRHRFPGYQRHQDHAQCTRELLRQTRDQEAMSFWVHPRPEMFH